MDYLEFQATRHSDELYHHGIKGQKWGVRRYQNEDGSLTSAGRERYSIVGGATNVLRRAKESREGQRDADTKYYDAVRKARHEKRATLKSTNNKADRYRARQDFKEAKIKALRANEKDKDKAIKKAFDNTSYKDIASYGVLSVGLGALSYGAGRYAQSKGRDYTAAALQGLGEGLTVGGLSATLANAGYKYLYEKKLK